MPTKKEGENVEKKEVQRCVVTRYGGGWGGHCNPEMGANQSVEGENVEKSYVRVRSEIDSLVRPHGR